MKQLPQADYYAELNYIDNTLPCRYEFFRDRENQLIVSQKRMQTTGLHIHDSLEFVYVESGEMEAWIGDEYHLLGAGQMSAVSSFVAHGYNGASARVRMLILPRTAVPGIGDVMGNKTFADCIVRDPDALILDNIRLMHAVKRRESIFAELDEPAADILLSSMALNFVRMIASLQGLSEGSGLTALIMETIAYIHLHFREELRIPDIAKALFCNQYTLTTRFHKAFGISIGDHINRVRALEVNRLLAEHPDMTLKEAADRSGFGSLRTLHRVFREEFGMTPREFLEAKRQDVSKG